MYEDNKEARRYFSGLLSAGLISQGQYLILTDYQSKLMELMMELTVFCTEVSSAE